MLCEVMWCYVMLCDVMWCYVIFNMYSYCLLCGTKEHLQSQGFVFVVPPENPRFPPIAAAQTSVLFLTAGQLGTANGRMETSSYNEATMRKAPLLSCKKNEVLFIPHSQSFGIVDHLNLTDQPLLAFGFKEEWTQKSIEFPKSPNLVTYPSPSITTSNTGSSDPSPLHPSTMPGSFSSR